MIDDDGKIQTKVKTEDPKQKLEDDEIFVEFAKNNPNFNLELKYYNNSVKFDTFRDILQNITDQFEKKESKQLKKYEPMWITDGNPETRDQKLTYKQSGSDVKGTNQGLIDRITGEVDMQDFKDFMPTTVLYQRGNQQDNDSVLRIKSNRLLKGIFDKGINYKEGLFRIIPQTILNYLTSMRTRDNINAGLILNNQLLFGYGLNSIIFKHEALLEKPKKNSICRDAFLMMINLEPGSKSPIETVSKSPGSYSKVSEDSTETIFKTSELSRIKSDERFRIALRTTCERIGGKSRTFDSLKIAKRQIKYAYSQKLLWSHKNNESDRYPLNDIFDQTIGSHHVKTVFWNMICGEAFPFSFSTFSESSSGNDSETDSSITSYLKHCSETVQINQRIKNGLDLIKSFANNLSELWIAQFSKEFEFFDGMLFQALNDFTIELFGLNRILNDKSNLKNLETDSELMSLIREYGMFIRRIISEGIATSSQEGLKLISITESFVSPVLSSFGSTSEFKDIHFEVFYAIDQFFTNPNFTRIIFRFLLCYYENYSAPDSIVRFDSKLQNQFPFKVKTIRLLRNGFNLKRSVLKLNELNETFQFENLIDVANVFILSPFSILSQISASKKSFVYRCLKIVDHLNSSEKTGAITYMNNIWKSKIINLPWTSFQTLNKKIIYPSVKGNSRVNELLMKNRSGESIKTTIEALLKNYKAFTKGNDEFDHAENSVLRLISGIFDKEYNFIYFNRSLTDEDNKKINIDSIRIPFSDLHFLKFGFMFCSSDVLNRPVTEHPICYHYSMVPEFEMETVATSDTIFTDDSRFPVFFKFPYIGLYSGFFTTPVFKIEAEGTKEEVKDSFLMGSKDFKELNPYIEMCGNETRRNIEPKPSDAFTD